MGSSPSPTPPWIPEDDLLLTKSVQDGASLKALAKGAVRFSRRYTLQELQDRWRALLYDPDIAAEASARMLELEQSTKGLKESKRAEKREAETESIRRCYYAERKRRCTEQLNQDDLAYCDDLNQLLDQDVGNGMDGAGLPTEQGNGCEEAGYVLDHDMALRDHCAPGDTGSDDYLQYLSEDFMNMEDGVGAESDHGEQAQLEDLRTEQGNRCEEAPRVLEDNTETDPMGNGLEGDRVLNSPASEYESPSQHLQQHFSTPAMPECGNRDEISTYGAMKTSAARRQLDFFAAPVDYPSNFREDEKYGLSNILFDSPEDMNVDQILLDASAIEPMVAAETDICAPSSSSAGELYANDNDETSTALAALSDYLFYTSENEILSIDDSDRYDLSKLLSDSPDDMNVDQIPHAFEFVPLDDAIQDPNITISASVLNPQLPELDRNGMSQLLLDSPADVNVDKILDASDVIPSDVIEEQNIPIPASVSNPQFPELHNGVICCTLNTEDLDVPFNDDSVYPGTEPSTVPAVTRIEVNNTRLESADEMSPQPTGEPLLPDAEVQFSDNDTEIPSFFDVESMILEMDLIPEDQDMHASREVVKYQHEEVKREIIRLEQAARSHMQRSIESHGAFAVLYGNRSKHYIKKLEVSLGRGTEESVVDIDLSIEEPTDKISRRQAILKLDEIGVFHLRNLGKCPISVDGEEAHQGQSLTLHSDCLIQIRTIAFVFVVNRVRVNRHVDSISRKKDTAQL